MKIAIDTGGTFTDCVYESQGELRVSKFLSTPENPARAVQEGVQTIAGSGTANVRHGTTVGTNALLERKGARVALVTTAGFEDVIAIGRQARLHLYDWFAGVPQCLVPRERRFGVNERIAADGTMLKCPSENELIALRDPVRESGAEAIAISLLFSFANPENERRVAEALTCLSLPMSLSHRILPEFREYERSSTVAVNAYLTPKVGGYLAQLNDGALASLQVMQSSGGIVPAAFAAQQPVRTILSGPAGGVMGAYFAAKRAGFSKAVTFDMGGTSTDVSTFDMEAGGLLTTNESMVSGMPIGVPTLDIHTVGAGGGSIAYFDTAGVLHVGPESAGASPGPICYGRGTLPTVSDANVVLGRLDPKRFLGGDIRLDAQRAWEYMDRARLSFQTVEDFAAAILVLAESSMERAIRVTSVERGHDPREFTLVAFGGAGPLHACALARALHMPRVLVPAMPGALSALGILVSDSIRDYSRTVMLPADSGLEIFFQELEHQSTEGVLTRSLDLRYAGQGYELNVAAEEGFQERFHAAHQKRFGYADRNRSIEVVNVRVRSTVVGEVMPAVAGNSRPGDGSAAIVGERPVFFGGAAETTRIYNRDLLMAGDRFSGPAIVAEYSATTVIPPGCEALVDNYSNLIIEIRP